MATVTPAGSRDSISMPPEAGATPGESTRKYQPVRPLSTIALTTDGRFEHFGELVAGITRLADLQAHLAPAPDIADARLVFQDPGEAQVLPERSGTVRLRRFELLGPAGPVLGRVGIDRLFRPAVDAQVALAVAADIGLGHRDGFGCHRLLANAAFDHVTAPLAEIARQRDIDRQELMAATAVMSDDSLFVDRQHVIDQIDRVR